MKEISTEIQNIECQETDKRRLVESVKRLLQRICSKCQNENYDIFSWKVIDLSNDQMSHNFQCIIFTLKNFNNFYEIRGYISSFQFFEYYADVTYHSYKNYLWIQDNYVKSSEMHNKGIGSLGMECIKELAKQLNCTKIQGKVQPKNINDKDELQKLINFYRKNSFVYTEETHIVTFVLN